MQTSLILAIAIVLVLVAVVVFWSQYMNGLTPTPTGNTGNDLVSISDISPGSDADLINSNSIPSP